MLLSLTLNLHVALNLPVVITLMLTQHFPNNSGIYGINLNKVTNATGPASPDQDTYTYTGAMIDEDSTASNLHKNKRLPKYSLESV